MSLFLDGDNFVKLSVSWEKSKLNGNMNIGLRGDIEILSSNAMDHKIKSNKIMTSVTIGWYRHKLRFKNNRYIYENGL